MIVPEFWAEARASGREGGRQVTLRRFGWSDTNQADAEVHAQSRADDALARVLAGERLPRRERRQAYGEAGLPIREELLERVGTAVITRNAYGAHCLNTPDVLFADVDFEVPRLSTVVLWRVWAASVVPIAALAAYHGRWVLGLVAAVMAIPFAAFVAGRWATLRLRMQGGAEAVAMRRIRAFAEANPQWGMRLYRTPAGLRVLATHRRFDPTGEDVTACFHALGVDPLYATMCRQQRCFRARLTGKPWRMGIAGHMRPRPGVWPVRPAARPLREAWVQEYEARAPRYAACRYVATLGEGAVDPAVAALVDLHDAATGALSDRPIA
ncbi:hypothetical protein [Lysobacter humi (ex Lee et al. 2017)]